MNKQKVRGGGSKGKKGKNRQHYRGKPKLSYS